MEWPQIVTTITEGNAISTVVDAPWVSVTSVNGMTGDVITEPIMENFQTNHYYPKNTIVNHNGMLYWAKNTFTSTNVFDADDWYTLDITSSKVLTGQLQKTSYRRSVVALCEVSTTNNTSLNSYTSGRLAFHRYNGLSGSVEINVQAENAYGTAYYFNFDYYSNLNLLDGTADIETAVGFRPCTFKYNNVWYGGIEVFIGNAEFANVTFDGAGNFNIFGLDYYSVAHGTTEASILNQEVYDSLNYTQWTLSRSDFYADAFFANSGKLKKTGGYVSTLPSKTGTLAQTSDIGNATLTIQRNGTTVNTFTANASSNVTANITVPTKTSDLTNNSGFITDAGVTSFNGSTGAVTYTAPVTSVNGSTGAVTVTNLERAELNVSPTSDIPSAWAAALPAGESWVWYNTASCFTNQPGRYGHLETIRNGGEVYQRWHGQSDGVTYYRAGNSTGWWGQSGGSGAFRKIIDNGQSATVTSNMIDWSTMTPYWKVVATSNTNTVTIPLNYKLYRIRIAGYKSDSSYWGVIGCNQATGTTWIYIQGTSFGNWIQAERSVNASSDKAVMDGARHGTPAGIQTWDIAISRTTLTEQNFVATWSTCTTGSNTYNTGRSIFTLTSGTGTMTLYNDLSSSITWSVEALIES